MAVIDFLHRHGGYSGATLRADSMGGTESSVVQLAEALARRGHDVSVFNGVERHASEFGVEWWPLAEAANRVRGRIGIAVASPLVFRGLAFKRNILWSHNPTTSWKQIQRGNLGQLLAARPTVVVLGHYHLAHIPRWLPYRDRAVIQYGVQADFFRPEPALDSPGPRAIFTSQPYRRLDWLLDLWPEVKRSVPGATFYVFCPKPHQAAANAKRATTDGVLFAGSLSRPKLIQELRKARVQFIPGHRDETYCLAAAEATASGVPVVTLGVGALSERVRDGKTGFIVRDKEAFIARAVTLLSDDAVWRRMHHACLSEAALTTWDVRALEWEGLFNRMQD